MNIKAFTINKKRNLMFRKSKNFYGQEGISRKFILINSLHQNGVD
jgi:hypothetical protein